MNNSELMSAIAQIAEEKGISKEAVLETVEAALAAAYRKDFGQKEQVVIAELDPKSEKTRLFVVHKIVEEVEDPMKEIGLKDAKKIDKKAAVGGEIREEVFPPAEYGRVAAQTAKQVILQRLREAERDIIFQEYKDKEGTLITGTVQRIEGDVVMIDIGKTTGILFPSEQSRADRYYVGQRMKFYVVKVDDSGKEPQVLLSRSHPDMIRRLFEMEVPEIGADTVEIKGVAREAGVRSKVAVHSLQEAVDPVGSLVGRRGVRVQAVMSEIGDEKIDIVLWNEDTKQYIINALSPAKIKEVILHEANHSALIKVEPDQLSLAIGKAGQNVRLASKLAGWQIEVEKGPMVESQPAAGTEETPASQSEASAETLSASEEPVEAKEATSDKPEDS
ncbi:TPA: transcription termination/antitermination protein NusA [Patescibacteria group bacterium]|uniref:Transcription termination/antitermination protein NusA n=2 Tax=Bacteria division Kazan-3B-28 TaxID=1798534 RepID=A0A0G1X8Y1_UNCK3|nr:MAG: NusA antitermination factor, N utilization substance protein A [candidate division Kazan bacterium GW2011_GWA1_50_15]KKW25730.1 MAG: NusA antitermination factor [candidate division Kazan bacterium GW2011_GWC1_52_13]KKW27255.1 MAG: NusA antitermination factor [candidate division Kazan bacterium GW2011_GWB1_52_7]HAV65981.1 transcription termination/antitermination protein NusA [Patescibacteria group bacterium]HCL47787.1 transcription termination/antitermination protein NusA [Patescibacter